MTVAERVGHHHSCALSELFVPSMQMQGIASPSFAAMAQAALQNLKGAPLSQASSDSPVQLSSRPAATGAAAPVYGVGSWGTSAAASQTATNYTQYIGRSWGSGQCVALVQVACPKLGATSAWTSGDTVQGNTDLKPGTIIATFAASGCYANATDGSSHTAIYLGQSPQGVQVLDQWVGSAAAVRTIAWSNPGGTAANTGSAFHVVNTG